MGLVLVSTAPRTLLSILLVVCPWFWVFSLWTKSLRRSTSKERHLGVVVHKTLMDLRIIQINIKWHYWLFCIELWACSRPKYDLNFKKWLQLFAYFFDIVDKSHNILYVMINTVFCFLSIYKFRSVLNVVEFQMVCQCHQLLQVELYFYHLSIQSVLRHCNTSLDSRVKAENNSWILICFVCHFTD